MPEPLSAEFAAILRSDRVVALAAAFIVGTHHPDVLHWVARAISAPKPRCAARGRKSDGGHKPVSADPYLDRRRAQRDRDDEALIEAMKNGGTIGDLAQAIGKSRSSTVTALGRLRDAGLAESVEGKWRPVAAKAPRASRWVEPVSAAAREHRAHASA
jgi:DNA-binding transcriptional ArsR family regulator